MSSFQSGPRKRWGITAEFSLDHEGLMTLRVMGFAKKPQGGLVAMATSVPVEGIPDRAERRRLEDIYVRRLSKRIRAFERGELPEPAEGSYIVELVQML
jgi:hypothetical protein